MPREKRKKTEPVRLRSQSPGLRLINQINYDNKLWKAGNLVAVIEDEEKYFAQVTKF